MAKPLQWARAAMNWGDVSGKTIQCIFYYELIGTFGAGYNIITAANALDTHISTTMYTWLSSDAIYKGLDVRINNNGVTSDASTFPATVGSAAAGAVPNEVAGVVHWQTAQPGKPGRGRSFISLFPATYCAGGRMTTAANTAITPWLAALNSALVDQGISWQLRHYSRLLDTMYPIASSLLDVLVGTQRRRRPKR